MSQPDAITAMIREATERAGVSFERFIFTAEMRRSEVWGDDYEAFSDDDWPGATEEELRTVRCWLAQEGLPTG